MPESLINGDGSTFDGQLAAVESELANLSNEERIAYRNRNAADVAATDGSHVLVVAGPGAGKSYLFLERIRHWLAADSDAEIYVASFVRKLVMDLQNDVKAQLSPAEAQKVTVSTLHQLARSLIERNRGTAAQPMRAHIRVIAPPWDDVVWDDVLQFSPALDAGIFSRDLLAQQFYTEELSSDGDWSELRRCYSRLCQFYNAVGFADMIGLAQTAVLENPELVSHSFWIFDEYQDFNAAEDSLVRAVTATAQGVMLAGDDDQALYQELKSSHPEIIISYYSEPSFGNAMLPFCSRCSYHVCQAASAFMSAHRDGSGIDKIYLPLAVDPEEPRVRVVGTASPSAAVDYIGKLLDAYSADLEAHVARMQSGDESDPFLLILSPDRDVRYFKGRGGADEALRALVEQWSNVPDGHSADYRRIATYFGSAGDARDNFSLRKVLHHENVLLEDIHRLIVQALEGGCNLSDLEDDVIRGAIEKCHRVAEILSTPELGPAEAVHLLSDLVNVLEPDVLARELAVDPIGTAATASEDELVLALPTAGRLSAVELMTMFGSKGLSAQHVIILGCDDVNLVNTSPLTFFVALTRARRTLHLVTSMKARGNSVHSYVHDLPNANCEYRWYTKKSGKPEVLPRLDDLLSKFNWLTRMTARGSRSRKR